MERFWSKVARTENEADCWLWLGATRAGGYGSIRVARKLEMAHRVSYLLAHGSIDEGLCVLHRCDNPACVNPAHLFLGTKKDNTSDRISKGRHPAKRFWEGLSEEERSARIKKAQDGRRRWLLEATPEETAHWRESFSAGQRRWWNQLPPEEQLARMTEMGRVGADARWHRGGD